MTSFYARRSRRMRVRRSVARRSAYRAKAVANRARVNAHNRMVLSIFEKGSSRTYNFGGGRRKVSLCRAVVELKKVSDENVTWKDDQHPRDLALHHSMAIELKPHSLRYKRLYIRSGEEASNPRRIFHMTFGGLVNFFTEKRREGPFKFLEKNEVEIKLKDLDEYSNNFCFIIPCKKSFEITTVNEFDRKKLPEDLLKRVIVSTYDPKPKPSPKKSKEKDGEKPKADQKEEKKPGTIVFCIIFRENHSNKNLWRIMGVPSKLGLEAGFEDLYLPDDLPRYEKTIQRILSVIDENEVLQERFLKSFKRIEQETKEITEKYEEGYVNFFKTLSSRKKGKIHIKCRAEGLDKMDKFGKSDPYFRIRVDGEEEDEESWYYKSEIIKKDLEPVWEPATCKKVRKLHKRHRLEVWDWNRIKKDKMIGYCTFIPQKIFKKNQKFSGWGGRREGVKLYISKFKDLSLHKKDRRHLNSGVFCFDQFIIFGGKGVKKEDVVRKYEECEKLKTGYDEAKVIGRRIQFKKIIIGKKKEEEEEEEGEEEEEQNMEDTKKGDVPEEEVDEKEAEESESDSDLESTDSSAKEESD